MKVDHETNEYIRKTIKRKVGLLKELENYANEYHVPIIQPEVAAFLTVVGKIHRPKYVLEVGTAIGYSALLFSEIIEPGGRIDSIERNESMVEIAKENIKRAGRESMIDIITGDAQEVLACLSKKYQMIFLDGAKGQYNEFLPECIRMLDEGGLLISDNVLYKGMIANDSLVVRRKKTIVNRMRSYLEILCADERLETSIIPIGDGVAMSYKIKSS